MAGNALPGGNQPGDGALPPFMVHAGFQGAVDDILRFAIHGAEAQPQVQDNPPSAAPTAGATMTGPQCRGITEAGERCQVLGRRVPPEELSKRRRPPIDLHFCSEHFGQYPTAVTYEMLLEFGDIDEDDEDWWYPVPGDLPAVPVAGGGRLTIHVHPNTSLEDNRLLTVNALLHLPGRTKPAGAIKAHMFERGGRMWHDPQQFFWAVDQISDEAVNGMLTFLDPGTMGGVKPTMLAPPYSIPMSCSTGPCLNLDSVAIDSALKGSGLGIRMVTAFLDVLDWSFCFTDIAPTTDSADVFTKGGFQPWPSVGESKFLPWEQHLEPSDEKHARLAVLDGVKRKLFKRFQLLGFRHAKNVPHMMAGGELAAGRFHWLSRAAFDARRWAPKLHAYATATVRKRVLTVFLVNRRLTRGASHPIPSRSEIWQYILGACGVSNSNPRIQPGPLPLEIWSFILGACGGANDV
eukprot:m.16477 g.16477  ORF g.16477 m.16477 type:complete len:463 (+) comp3389_c0_seq1:181-1569(+)